MTGKRETKPTSSAPEGATGLGPSTRAVHAGEARQKALNAITDPIVCASTYTFSDTQAVIRYIVRRVPSMVVFRHVIHTGLSYLLGC